MDARKIVGRKYRLIKEQQRHEKTYEWAVGAVLTLVEDDGDGVARFCGPKSCGKNEWYLYMDEVELLPEDFDEQAYEAQHRAERIAELEKELAELKAEEAKEKAPWTKFREGDEVLVRAVVTQVESGDYCGKLQVEVVANHSKDSVWFHHLDIAEHFPCTPS